MILKKRQMLYGIATYLPGVNAVFGRGGGDSKSARYCYSVWLRHLVSAFDAGATTHPKVVAELGPGDTLGVGIAALISGADSYKAFDVVHHANVEHNVKIFDELVAMFQKREPIPGDAEFPEVRPLLADYAFPTRALAHLDTALSHDRLMKLRAGLRDSSVVQYRTRWFDATQIETESVDLVCSQAVLEHVDELDSTYRAMRAWLKPGGLVSHQIDFRCHNTASVWNGHWAHGDLAWKLIRGKRSYLLNREPCSAHIKFLADNKFDVIRTQRVEMESQITRKDLAPRFKNLSDADLSTCGVLLQAIKR